MVVCVWYRRVHMLNKRTRFIRCRSVSYASQHCHNDSKMLRCKMLLSNVVLLALTCPWVCLGYVDFGQLTQMKTEPTMPVPRPHQLPQEWEIRYKPQQHPIITALTPFLTMRENGTTDIGWHTAYHAYSRHFSNARGVFKRQNGVFESDASLLATCTPCATSIGNQTTSSSCYASTYTVWDTAVSAVNGFHINASIGYPECSCVQLFRHSLLRIGICWCASVSLNVHRPTLLSLLYAKSEYNRNHHEWCACCTKHFKRNSDRR